MGGYQRDGIHRATEVRTKRQDFNEYIVRNDCSILRAGSVEKRIIMDDFEGVSAVRTSKSS